MVQNRSLFVLLMLAAMTLPPTLARQAISAVTVAQAPDAAPPAEAAPEGIDPFDAAPPAEPSAEAAPEAATPELPPAFTLPESLPADTTLTIDGSVSMAAINRTLIRRFEDRFPGVTVVVQEQGTAAALQGLGIDGGPDLAAIGRPLSSEESAQGLVEVPLSREKIAIIVGNENPFQGDLTFDQFAQIFRGEISNWLYVGGPDLPIRFVDRPADSDTRRALSSYDIFQAVEFSTGDNAIAVAVDDTAAVVEALNTDGISYAIASQVLDQDNVRALTMDGTLPDDPRYPYSQPRGYAYAGPPSPAVEAFLAFATSADGQAALAEAKLAEAADVATAELPTSVTAMRPNGQGFVTGDREGNIKFWNIDGSSAGEPEEAAHTGPITALAFSPDGNRIISGGADGMVRFWDAVGTPVGEPIPAHSDPVSTLAVFPDGTFASASTDGSLRRWDINGSPVGDPIAAHGDTIRATTVSADGQTLVTAGNDGQVKLWNPDGTAKGAFSGHDGPVTAVALKPDNTVVTGGEDSTVRLWDGAGAPLGSQPTAGPVTALAVSADGEHLATGDNVGTVQMRNGDGTPAGEPISDVGGAIGGLAFTPDGERLVVSAQDQPPQLRNQAGDLVSQAAPETDNPGEEGNLAGLWQKLQALGPRLWILLPILLLAILLWVLLQGVLGDEDEDEDEAVAEPRDQAEPGLDSVNPPATASGEAMDWSAAAGSDADFGQADFGQADFGFEDAPAADFVSAPVSFDQPVPDAIAVTPAAQGLDSRLSKARTALGRGLELAQSGNLQAALDSTNQAIESADVERLKAIGAGVSLAGVGAIIARGMARRGGILTALKRPEDALKSYDRALQLAPNDLAAWLGKGNLLLTLNRSDEALFCFDKAIELEPNSGTAWQGKGEALQQMHRTADAAAALAQAKTLGTGSESTFTPMGAGIGAALGGAAALGALTGLRPDGPKPDRPADWEAALSDLPEANAPEPDSSDVPPIAVPEEVNSFWPEAEDKGFDDEDATIIQAGLPDQDADYALASLPSGDVEPDDIFANAPVDFALEQSDLGDLDADFGEESALVDFSVEPGSENDLSLDLGDEFAISAPSDDEGVAIDLGSNDEPVNFSMGDDEGAEIEFSLDDEAEVGGAGVSFEDGVGRFPAIAETVDGTVDNLQDSVLEADIPDEVLAALEGISGLTPAAAEQNAPAAAPPPPPPRRPAPPPLPSNPKLEAD